MYSHGAGVGKDASIATVERTRAQLAPPRRWYGVTKVGIDLVVATLSFVALSPVLLVAALAVRFSSPGPVLFRHQRVGRSGVPFVVYKFRTMRTDTGLPPDAIASFRENYKLAADPRITPVGRWLRRTSLDEAPQLLNVLSGTMSMVGPRPVTPAELQEKYGDHADELVSVKPGLTGLWQVSGRSSLTYRQRVDLDLRYVRERGLWADLKIIARTPLAVLLMRGAE
ncbi:MAG: sugar transferase [Dehalococcoidia bacterium]|nr:sugar transferase [Dehalococcoidia bacterium]